MGILSRFYDVLHKLEDQFYLHRLTNYVDNVIVFNAHRVGAMGAKLLRKKVRKIIGDNMLSPRIRKNSMKNQHPLFQILTRSLSFAILYVVRRLNPSEQLQPPLILHLLIIHSYHLDQRFRKTLMSKN